MKADPDVIMDMLLLDCEDRRCGRVDGLEIAADGTIKTIRCGPGAWRERLPGRLGRHFGDDVVEIPWTRVTKIERGVHLDSRAQDLGLGRGDDELRWLLSHLPWRDAQ
jgi:hypothetical protein